MTPDDINTCPTGEDESRTDTNSDNTNHKSSDKNQQQEKNSWDYDDIDAAVAALKRLS